MDIEEAKRFCQVGIEKGFFGVDEVRESLSVLRQRAAQDPDATIQAVLVEKGFLKPSQAMDILRDLGPDDPPAGAPGQGFEETRSEPEPEDEPAIVPADDLWDGGDDMTLDAEALSESMEMFAISEDEPEPPASEQLTDPEPPEAPEPPPAPPEEPPTPEPEAQDEPEPEATEPEPEATEPEPEATEPEPEATEPEPEPEATEPDEPPAPPAEEPAPAQEEPTPEPAPRVEEAATVDSQTPTSQETVAGSTDALAAASTAREAVDRATQGSLLTADDFFRCLNLAFQKEKIFFTVATFVGIAVLGAVFRKLGLATESDLWFRVSQGLTLVLGLVGFMALTGLLARSTNLELDGKAPLDPRSAVDYLKHHWLTLLASPTIFLVGLTLATLLAVGLFYLIGHIPYLGPIVFGLTTLLVFGILLSAFVLGFLGLLVIPAAVAVEQRSPIETVKVVAERVRNRPVPLLFTEVLAFLFISIVTFALGTVVAIPFSATNALESEVQQTEQVGFLFRSPASEAVTDVAGTNEADAAADTEEQNAAEKTCYWIGGLLYMISMYIILAAVLTVPYIFIAVLQVPAYRALA